MKLDTVEKYVFRRKREIPGFFNTDDPGRPVRTELKHGHHNYVVDKEKQIAATKLLDYWYGSFRMCLVI